MTTSRIPTDDAKAADTKLTPDDWRRAEGAHERYKELLEVKPRAKARNNGRARRDS
jgi:hypothetical protein